MKTYFAWIELNEGRVLTWPGLENRDKYPFGENEFNNFFQRFVKLSFEFPHDFKTILIYDAKENPPNHSYAIGWLFAESPEAFNEYQERTGEFPKHLGEVRFEDGGSIGDARITVSG